MTLKAHTVQSVIVSAAASYYLTWPEVAVLFFSIILIDIDHYFDFVCVTRRFGLRDMFRFHDFVWRYEGKVYGLSALHTVEVFVLLYLLGFYYSHFFLVVLAGFLMHMVLDIYSLVKHDMLFNRAYFLIEYPIRRKILGYGYPVPDEAFWKEGDEGGKGGSGA